MKAVYMGICNVKKGRDQRVFMMDPPHQGHEFVMVSARNFDEFNARFQSGATSYLSFDSMSDETYIFGCDSKGEVVSWRELEGSYKGGMSHAQALANAGYTIVSSVEELKGEE